MSKGKVDGAGGTRAVAGEAQRASVLLLLLDKVEISSACFSLSCLVFFSSVSSIHNNCIHILTHLCILLVFVSCIYTRSLQRVWK